MYQAGREAYRQNPNPPSRRKFERDLWQQIYEVEIPESLRQHKADRMYHTGLLRRRVLAYLSRRMKKTPAGRRAAHCKETQNASALLNTSPIQLD